jgi:hypothetical protein
MHQEKKVCRFKSVIAFSLTVTMFAIMIARFGDCAAISKSPSVLPSVMFKFAVTADSRAAGGAAMRNGVSTVVLDAIARDIASQGVDFVLFPGDMVSGETDTSTDLSSMLGTWKATMGPVYNTGIQVYVTRGDHEYNTPTNGTRNPL